MEMLTKRDLTSQIVSNAVESIVSINSRGVIIGFNPAAVKLFGFEKNEVIGQNAHILIPLEHASHHHSYVCNYIRTNKRRLNWLHSEIKIQRKDMSLVAVVMTLTETVINAEKIFTSVMRVKDQSDISHHIIEKNFVARMSHELRTPLNRVIGMANILFNTMLTDEQNDIVETIVSSSEGLLQVLNNILDFSKDGPNMVILDHAPLDLREIVDHVMDLLVVSARFKHLHLYVTMDEMIHTKVLGDMSRIQRVYMNIIECNQIH